MDILVLVDNVILDCPGPRALPSFMLLKHEKAVPVGARDVLGFYDFFGDELLSVSDGLNRLVALGATLGNLNAKQDEGRRSANAKAAKNAGARRFADSGTPEAQRVLASEELDFDLQTHILRFCT